MPAATRRFELRLAPAGDAFEASLSSEFPVERDFGIEVLDHSTDAVDLSRARDGLPLLFNHDLRQLIGRVDGIYISDRRLRGRMRFFDTAAGRDARSAVESGHREVSISYEILRTRSEPDKTIRVLRWRPYEASVVSVPADANVGIGRTASQRKEANMNQNDSNDNGTHGDDDQAPTLSRSQRRAATALVAQAQQGADERVEGERTRIKAITNMGRMMKLPAEMTARAIDDDLTVDEFAQVVLAHQASASRIQSFVVPASSFGDSDGPSVQQREWQELQSGFSLSRAIQAQIDPSTYLRGAGRESEVSRELSRHTPLATSGTLVPYAALFGGLMRSEAHKRALSVGTSTLGGATVQTTIDPSLFADALRSRTVCVGLGARVLTGLRDTTVIPRKTSATTGTWVTEAGSVVTTDPNFDQVTLSPKRFGAFTDVSRQLLVQSVLAMEQVIQQDLSQTILVELDRVAMLGTGASNQPRGIVNTSGIGSVVGGTNGAQIAWSHVLDLERTVAAANAQVNLAASGYAINAQSRGWMKRTLKVTGVGTPLIMGDDQVDEMGLTRLNGYRTGVSSLLPSTGTKGTSSGVCSTLIFGDWSQLFIGLFGDGVELIVDPYTLAVSGQVRITSNLFGDIGVRYAASFAAMTDALTV